MKEIQISDGFNGLLTPFGVHRPFPTITFFVVDNYFSSDFTDPKPVYTSTIRVVEGEFIPHSHALSVLAEKGFP